MTVVVLGEMPKIQGLRLAGALVIDVGTPQEALAAWTDLDDEVRLVIITPEVAEAIGDLQEPGHRLRVVLP